MNTSLIITVEGKPAKRYVVCPEDEHHFAGVPLGKVPEAQGTPALGGTTRAPSINDIRSTREEYLGRFYFGCQALRSGNRVGEMCTLGTWEVVRVARGQVTR